MRDNYGYFEGEQLGRWSDLRLWLRILSLAKPYWLGALGAVLLSAAVVACGLALPSVLRQAVDNCILNQAIPTDARLAGLSRLALFFAGLMAAEFAANFLQVLVLEWTGQHTMHRMRRMLFGHLLRLDLAFFHRHPTGRLVTRLTNDVQNMHEMFTSVVVTLFNDAIKMAAILAILFWMDWRLTLCLCLLLPLMTGQTLWFSRLARDAFRLIRSQLSKINAFLQENLSGMTIIQLFGQEGRARSLFGTLNQEYTNRALRQIKIFAIFMPMIELLNAMAIATILWYGGSRIMAGELSIGALVAFLAYMRLFFQPMRELSQKYSIVQSALASAERIFQLLDTREMLPMAAAAQRPERVHGAIEFRAVTFGYDPGQPVLSDFSLTVPPGEVLAVVGATGSGKSTVISLLERFYDPGQGAVLLDGIDIRELDPEWLRQRIGLVMQDVLLIPGTIRDNVLLDETMDDQQLLAILEKARLGRLMARLPEGLDTRIGDGGMDLSAGERQLLALARVLARNPRVLVLDEATASVDAESEMLLEEALASTFAGRTSIVIAHRLSTVRRADRILVMEQGRIVEQGSHAELAASNGPYRRLLAIFSGEAGGREPGTAQGPG
ncbi:MAG: ABC transporter ATP-binding protein [Thermodesulfobacteriota bacterium]